ncbi:MAG: serine/threonine-protein kinase [Phycisphaerae bacterium]
MAYRFKHGDRPLDDYTIQRGVGRGGFGEVYYAVSDGGREVALKYLRDNPELELRGVSQCMNLKSPHLVTIFDVKKSDEGEYFIVMEYVSGPSLRDLLIAEADGLGPQKAAYFVREIAKGLSYLHDRGIVHRDMKPGNIFYEDGYVKIGDYGLSKFIAVSRHSAQTASIGTVHYMAPEVGSGNYSRGIDIYAVGVMLYEMLLGKVPFEGASMGEVLMKHLTEQPEVDNLPAPFGRVIRKALAKDPNERYQTVDEMVGELFEVVDVRQSVGGFNPTSLSGVARRAAGDLADSPVPSPNPMAPPKAIPVAGSPVVGQPHEWVGRRRLEEVSGRLAKRMDRIDRKMEKKLNKLSGGRPARQAVAAEPAMAFGAAVNLEPGERFKRLFLAGIMATAIGVGVGVLVAQGGKHDLGIYAGVSSSLLVMAIAGGVLLARWLAGSMLSGTNPSWVHRLITLACCLPFMGAGAAPVFAEGGDDGLAALLALLIVTALTNWNERLNMGSQKDLKIWDALWGGFVAFVFAHILDADSFALLTAGVTAGALLSVQVLGWAWPPVVAGGGTLGGRIRDRVHHHRAQRQARQAASSPRAEAPPMGPLGSAITDDPRNIPLGIPMDQRFRGVGRASNAPPAPMRSGFARAIFSILAFLLAGGMIICIILLAMETVDYGYANHHGSARMHYSDVWGFSCGMVSCFSWMIFALRKTTQRKRPGFWKETLRPFLQAASMTAMGVTISALALPREYILGHDGHIPAIVGLVFGSLLFVVLLFARGRRQQASFVAGDFNPAARAVRIPVAEATDLDDSGAVEVDTAHPPPPVPPQDEVARDDDWVKRKQA